VDYIIIVAGGKGLRMGGDIPKQFIPIAGKPVLMRTIERFREYSPDLQIILVLPKAQQDYWHQLCEEYHFPYPQPAGTNLPPLRGTERVSYQIADGGETRFHSVQNGLRLIPDDEQGIVGVHDGVRPFVSVEVIKRCYDAARTHKAVIPVVPVVETLRHLSGDKGYNVLRSDYRLVQTPQAFDIQLLKAANQQPYTEQFTDDASVVEAFGQTVTMVEGNRENIKLTTPFDLRIAEVLV
jgi:2-C-methyl-D-erythritol 4-phosphate cytidylyltransferase